MFASLVTNTQNALKLNKDTHSIQNNIFFGKTVLFPFLAPVMASKESNMPPLIFVFN